MSILSLVLIGLIMGLVFGIALEKSRVFEPGAIVGQLQLRNFILLKVFLTAAATGMVVLAVLAGSDVITLAPKAAVYGANILGGALMGAGIALAGACPGTVLAQIGAGYKDAWAILVGGIFGAMTFGYLEPALSGLMPENIINPTLADLTGLPFWLLALVFAAISAVILYALEKKWNWKDDLGKNHDALSS